MLINGYLLPLHNMFYYYLCVQIKPLIFPVWGMWRSTLDKMPLSSVWQLDVPMKQRSFCWRWVYSRFLVFSANCQVLSNSIIISQRLKFWLAASQQNYSTKLTQSTWMVIFKKKFFLEHFCSNWFGLKITLVPQMRSERPCLWNQNSFSLSFSFYPKFNQILFR